MSFLKSPSVALGLVTCSRGKGSCWKSGLRAGGVPIQSQTNVTVDVPALQEPEECLQWASGISPGLSI